MALPNLDDEDMSTPDEKLIAALQEFGAARAEVQQLRADLKETSGIVQSLAKQILRIETQAEAMKIDTRVAAIESRIQTLEWDKAARIGGKETGSNIWKYSTWIFGTLLVIALAIIGWWIKSVPR